ncbi:MAG: response regulator, partial [Deltaproteobacteria bacterium]|nr:response regulator [Deltaproteobacteria bacterium]
MSMPRILIVEDEPVVAMSLRRHLTTWGYHVVGQAVRGEQAVVLAKEFEPDLVLMDIQLVGDIDG